MPDHTKVFSYQEAGLSYTITVYEENGTFYADIQVNEGAMDLNAVYWADDTMSGPSTSLGGPLNMNGAGSLYDGEAVQWDDAVKISDPGLGPEGTGKTSYLTEGEVYKVELDIDSLDDINFIGIRATSTTTDSGSIKGVSGDPEEPEDDPLHDKLFFDYGTDENGAPLGGVFILSEEPEDNPYGVPSLPEGTEPTFENYLSYFEEIGGEIGNIESIVFYERDGDGNLQESFEIVAPDGGFQSSDEILDAYDAAMESMSAAGGDPGSALMASLSTGLLSEDEPYIDEDEDEPEEVE
ncbi:hypothetical protein ACSBLW_07230 [Thioclava sp. FR2]|uniref:hypothetical protein n=1 Tax=Thioclava sp. FR2 TaxID=3445780 RepID=UPI003EB973D0